MRPARLASGSLHSCSLLRLDSLFPPHPSRLTRHCCAQVTGGDYTAAVLPPGFVGGSGTQLFSYAPLAPGSAALVFEYGCAPTACLFQPVASPPLSGASCRLQSGPRSGAHSIPPPRWGCPTPAHPSHPYALVERHAGHNLVSGRIPPSPASGHGLHFSLLLPEGPLASHFIWPRLSARRTPRGPSPHAAPSPPAQASLGRGLEQGPRRCRRDRHALKVLAAPGRPAPYLCIDRLKRPRIKIL